MMTAPQNEHRWLDRLVGEWTFDGEAQGAPGEAPMKSTGTESVRSLGGLWVQCLGRTRMPDGSPAEMVMTLGFDPARGRYVGTWIGSMMSHLWVYDGWLDDAGRVLTLESQGPGFAGDGTTSTYRDVIEILSDDERRLSGNVLGADGQWTCFMTATYRRTAA